MNFDPTWRQVALLAVLLSAVVVTHLFAPLAVSAVTSIVSTIVGAFFVNLPPGDRLKGKLGDGSNDKGGAE